MFIDNGRILIGKKIDTTFDEKLVIDFNDMSIALSYNINGTEKMHDVGYLFFF